MTGDAFDEAFNSYLAAAERLGSLVHKVILPLADEASLDALRALTNVTLPAELVAYFRRVDGYSIDALAEYELFEPSLAWSMFALSVEDALSEHESLQCTIIDDEPGYWADGFLPILTDGAGSVVAVNCIAESPTFGAVYEMIDCVGLVRIASSLTEFFKASTAAIDLGLIQYDDGLLAPEDHLRFIREAAPLYGDSPYFARTGQEDDQIVDWL